MHYSNNNLDKSILFDIYTYPKDSKSLQDFIHEFQERIINKANLKKSGSDNEHYKNSIKQQVLNCVVSIITQRPIAKTLNKSDYCDGERLKKLFMSYNHDHNVFKILSMLEYIEVANGVRELGKVTRFWPSEKFVNELMPHITEPPVKAKLDQSVFLRAKKKTRNSKAFKDFEDDSHPDIPQIKSDIEYINKKFIDHTVTLDCQKIVVPETFLDFLEINNINGQISIDKYDCHYRIIKSLTDNVYENVTNFKNYKFDYYNYKLQETTTRNRNYNTLTLEPLKPIFGKSKEENKKYYNGKVISNIVNQTLDLIAVKNGQNYYYLDQLLVIFNDISLKRVFNEKFDLGGRFFSTYQFIPSFLRKNIKIDNEPTVEVDIKACTLQMLYHSSGFECPNDPYSMLNLGSEVGLDSSEDIRKNLKRIIPIKEKIVKYLPDCPFVFPIVATYELQGIFNRKLKKYNKFIQIVVANALDKYDNSAKEIELEDIDLTQKKKKSGRTLTVEQTAIKAIHSAMMKDGLYNITYVEIEKIIDKFKKVHDPISSHLFKGIGRKLQYFESRIANRVLLHFAEKNIKCLCIHDSFRIGKSHKEELIEVIKKEYFEELGFSPQLTIEP